MDINDDIWYVMRNIPGVTGFIGSKSKPVSLLESEVNHIIKQSEERKEKPTPKVVFEKGDNIKIIEGPFINFNGTVEGKAFKGNKAENFLVDVGEGSLIAEFENF